MDQVPFMNNAQLHGCKFEGWQCFHCGEVFTTVGAAAEVARLTAYKAWAEIEIANDRDDLSRITKQALEAEARIRAVEGLPEKWKKEQSEYPDSSGGQYAAAAVRLCADELQAALEKQP